MDGEQHRAAIPACSELREGRNERGVQRRIVGESIGIGEPPEREEEKKEEENIQIVIAEEK